MKRFFKVFFLFVFLACVSLWITGYGYIFYDGSNSDASNGNLWIEFRGGGSVSGTSDLRDNSWHHVAVTYDGTVAKAYVDGELEGENYFSTGFETSPGYPLKFGHVNHDVGSNEHFPGILDEVSIWNIALDQEEILSQMNQELLGSEEGLAGYWNFNEGQGEVAYDMTENQNHGEIVGANYSTETYSPCNNDEIVAVCIIIRDTALQTMTIR